MLRQLTREDLPSEKDLTDVNKREVFVKYKVGNHWCIHGDSLDIPVVYEGRLRFVSDINFANNSLCYLKDNDGKAVRISDCELICDYNEYLRVIKKLNT